MHNKKYIFLLVVIIIALLVVGLSARKKRDVPAPVSNDGRVQLNYEERQAKEKILQESRAEEKPITLTEKEKAAKLKLINEVN